MSPTQSLQDNSNQLKVSVFPQYIILQKRKLILPKINVFYLVIFKTSHFQLSYLKANYDLSISQKLQIKKTHNECIPQAGQKKQDSIYKSYICVLFSLRLCCLSKLVSWHCYAHLYTAPHFCKVTKKLHKVWKLWSSNTFCEFTYRGTDFFYLINYLCLLLNSGIHICVCCFNKLNIFLT